MQRGHRLAKDRRQFPLLLRRHLMGREAPGEDIVLHAHQLLGLTPPPVVNFEEAAPALSEMARSFYADNKRVRNDRIKGELGVVLRYPDYRAGLTALLSAGE